MSERAPDPYGAHRFRVSCDVLPTLGFSEVRGLSVSVVERDDESRGSERQSKGRRWVTDRSRVTPPPARREAHSPTLELRRGLTDEVALWGWLQSWVAGEVDPQDVRVCLLDGEGKPVRGWVCRAATPVRWVGPELVADRAAVATETIELAHEGIDVVTDLAECEA